jgi:hypothetical protein
MEGLRRAVFLVGLQWLGGYVQIGLAWEAVRLSILRALGLIPLFCSYSIPGRG